MHSSLDLNPSDLTLADRVTRFLPLLLVVFPLAVNLLVISAVTPADLPLRSPTHQSIG